jgi:SPP1 gp7 family putative phage head morphogenesis protein
LQWDHWTAPYILGVIRAAWDTAGGRLRVRGGRISDTEWPEDAGVEGAFDIGVRPSLLRDLYLQCYRGLADIVDDAAADDVRATITEGVAAGLNPRDIARELTADIRKLQRTRAEAHVRTTTAHARTQSTLGRYEAAGESVVSHVEFSDSADTRVCAFCRRLDGIEMTIEEMQGTHVLFRGDVYRLSPPAHTNGRCLPLPAVGASAPEEPLGDRLPASMTILTTQADPNALAR